jgi:hypothetical protein
MFIISKFLIIVFCMIIISCLDADVFGDTKKLTKGYSLFNERGKIQYLRCSDNPRFENEILLPVFVTDAKYFTNNIIKGKGWIYGPSTNSYGGTIREIYYYVNFDINISSKEIVVSKINPEINIINSGLLRENFILYKRMPSEFIFKFETTSDYKVFYK